MKTFNLSLLFTLSALLGFAQATPNDSVLVLNNYGGMVFYSASTGGKTVSSNTDWHLAISVRPTPIPPGGTPITGVTVRINEQAGVNAMVAAGNNASTYTALDTTTMANWAKLHDSDTDLDKGALNSNANSTNAFDFGWGKYDQPSHTVFGDSVFVFELPGGAKKKLLIESLVYDTVYNIKYSNLDNSNARTFTIRKADYAGKNFIYLNLLDYSVKNKEPLSSDWDLQFLRYTASDVPTLPNYGTVGVWSNKGVQVAKVSGRDVDDQSITGLTYSSNLNAIGWDWKTHVGSGVYTIEDSTAYYIRAKDGNRYQLVFTRFGGTSTGAIAFRKSAKIPFGVGIEETTENGITVFPNPANNLVNVLTTVPGSNVKLVDMNGRVVAEEKVTNNLVQFNTGELAIGMYLLTITNGHGITSRKLVVTH